MNRRFLYFGSVLISLAVVVAASSIASGDEFYKGKTLRIIVGYSPGGGYDTYARFFARHISKYLNLARLVEKKGEKGWVTPL